MTYKEMQLICKKQYGKCKKCPLNVIEDWNCFDKQKATWCLKECRERYINKYKMHLQRGQKELAENTIKEYVSIEQKYFKKEK